MDQPCYEGTAKTRDPGVERNDPKKRSEACCWSGRGHRQKAEVAVERSI